MGVKYYRLDDGRIWNVEKAEWLDGASPANAEDVVLLQSAAGASNVEYLARTLAFYGYPLGALASENGESIRARLKELDESYLTPRVLAGLATNDPYAKTQWLAHEELAGILREKLKSLTQNLQ